MIAPNRASLARLAVRAYPADVRAARSDETIGTLLDAAEDAGTFEFGRDLASVLWRGLSLRAAHSQAVAPRRLLTEALAVIGLLICAWVGTRSLIAGAPETPARIAALALLAVVVLFGVGCRRLAGCLGAAIVVGLLAHSQAGGRPLVLAGGLLTVPMFAAMFGLGVGHRVRLVERGWGLLIAALVILVAAVFGRWPLGWELLAVVGIAALAFRPSVSLAAGTMLALTGCLSMEPGGEPTVALMLAAPVTLVLLIAARRGAAAAAGR